MSALLISFIYLFYPVALILSLKAKNECNVLENEEHVTVSKKETKAKGGVCWGSLVRRHIKAIHLIDEVFYKLGVKSLCHSSSFILFSF